jgi:hypothetical protein
VNVTIGEVETPMGTARNRPTGCPAWCVRRHGDQLGEEDLVHLSKSTFVRNVLVRLCATIDPHTGGQDGPYILVGGDEYTLAEGSDLADILAALVRQGRGVTPHATV